MLLSKGMKSLQLSLNDIIPKLKLRIPTVTAMAYSKARAKLRHTAFMELNDKAVVQTMYEHGDYQTLHGLRLLAVDGSKVQLPDGSALAKEFGTMAYGGKTGTEHATGEHTYALASVLYDVLNHIAIDAQFVSCKIYEPYAAESHLKHLQPTDLVIFDRGYASYRMLARVELAGGQFLVRCPASSFAVVRNMFTGAGASDQTVDVKPNPVTRSDPDNKDLPASLRVRFIRVQLETGEYEVLATSLLDTELYPYEIFKELYYYRWGVETFYGKLKTRLGLENFSGLSIEAVKQDFHVAVLLTGVETIFTEDAEVHLGKQVTKHQQKVNEAVSFSAIKQRAFELFMSRESSEQVLEQLTELFQKNPTLVRTGRPKRPRGTKVTNRRLQFMIRKRKSVF